MIEKEFLFSFIRGLHFAIFDEVRRQMGVQSIQGLSEVVDEGNGDVTYRIDDFAERIIDAYLSANLLDGGLVLVCEGLGRRCYPSSVPEEDAAFVLIIDPLDGTREIMYDKRSCWILSGLAPNRGRATCLADIFLCVQTEVPPTIQDRSYVLEASRGNGAFQSIWNVGERRCLQERKRMKTTGAENLVNGFAVFVNCFPSMKRVIGTIEDEFLARAVGSGKSGQALVFDDEYISSAGQLWLLASGRYRMVADIRGFIGRKMEEKGQPAALCCHPYDLSTYLIFTEAGGILVGMEGKELTYPLDLDTPCPWIGYANGRLFSELQPILEEELGKADELI